VVDEDVVLRGSSRIVEDATVEVVAAHPFNISMRDPEVVKVGYARRRLGEL